MLTWKLDQKLIINIRSKQSGTFKNKNLVKYLII